MQSRAAGGPSYGLPLEHVRLLQLSAECDSRSPRQRAMRAAQLVRWIHCRVAENARHIANAVHAVLGSVLPGPRLEMDSAAHSNHRSPSCIPSLTSAPASSCRIPVATWAGERSGA
jgi:hypothetical protein